ncbi:hypothetical protein ACQR1Y_11580 [Bradyrhizobium sp. HKCCYLRH3099]|uniref:hypothetical protein n=1 Tax=unclassified Bradyrhizobium TaxID=2631580 RepID=UPI003EBA1713
MEYLRFAAKFAVAAVLAGAAVFFAYLFLSGEIPKTYFEAIGQQMAPSILAGGSLIAFLAIAICSVLGAIAPLVYAVRSRDWFTVVLSIVALVLCATLLFSSRTVVDMVLAAIIYFTSAIVSVVMYSTNRITKVIASKAL